MVDDFADLRRLANLCREKGIRSASVMTADGPLAIEMFPPNFDDDVDTDPSRSVDAYLADQRREDEMDAYAHTGVMPKGKDDED